MRILPVLLILVLATATAGIDISEILGEKLEVKKEQTKQEKIWEDAFVDKLSPVIAKLEDKARINLQDKTGNIKSTQKSFNKTTEITIENHPIKRIKINNATGNHTIKIDQPEIPNAIQTFAIDPTETKFTNGEIEIIAKGNQLYKCPTWNYTTETCEPTCTWDESEQQTSCEPKWIYQKDITPGQHYTIEITPNDPAYYETSATPDVSIAPLTTETFIIAFIDAVQSDASYRIYNTNGSILLNTTDIDTTVDNVSRIKVAALNATDFVIAYVDGPDNDLSRQIIRWNGSSATNITTVADIDTEIGDNTDAGIAVMSDTYAVCNANQNDLDADFRIYWHNGTQIVGESNTDGSMGPETTSNNIVDCTGINESRWAYFYFDDTTVNDATYSIRENNGTSITITDIDTDVGETGQVAVTSLDPSRFGMVWYDSTDQDITIAIRNAANTAILAATDIDTAAGTDSRVAAATIRKNSTETDDLLVAVWQDQAAGDIQASVYYQNGTQLTAPFQVTNAINTTYQLIDAIGRDTITGNRLCPGKFIVAFSNQSGQGEFLGFYSNGTSWNGTCEDMTGPALSNMDPDGNLYPNTYSSINISVTAQDVTAVNSVVAVITNTTGSNTTLNLTGTGTYSATYILSEITGRYNVTYIANDTLGNQNTHTTFFEIGLPVGEAIAQRGKITSTGTTLNATTNATPTNNTFIFFTASTTDNSPAEWQVTPDMPNSTTIQFNRYSGTSELNISWVSVYSPDITVQRGTVSFASGNSSASVDITSVNTTETFAIIDGRCNTTTNANGLAGFFLANITNSTRVEIRRGNEGLCDATAHYQIVSWKNSRVQRKWGTIPSNGATFTNELDKVNRSATFATLGWASIGTDNGMDTNLLKTDIGLTGKTAIISHLSTAILPNSQRDAAYYLVELPTATTQSDEISFINDVNETINSVDPEKSFLVYYWTNSGGGTTWSNSRLTAELIANDTINFHTATASTTNTLTYFITETPKKCLGTITTNTNLNRNISAILLQGQNCITIGADNIELNCNGNTITGKQNGNGIYSQNKNNITIRNCIVNNFTTNILLSGTTNSNLINNTLLNASEYSINATDSHNNTHANSTYNNQISNTAILTNTNNNTITNTTIEGTNTSISILGANNTVNNSTIKTNNGTAIDFKSGNNNITNTTIETNNTWIKIATGASSNNLTNITFKSANGSITTLATASTPTPFLSELSVNTTQLNTSHNQSFLNDTQYSFLNISSRITLNDITFQNPIAMFDKTDNNTYKPCVSPDCENISYTSNTFIFDVLGFSKYAARNESPPTAQNVTLSATNISNTTATNLTVTSNTADAENDKIKNITIWKINQTDIAGLVMPFEAQSNRQKTNTKDHSENSNNGTVNNATYNSTGGHDGFGAYSFTNSFINISDHSSLRINQNGTITAWIKPRTISGYKFIIEKGQDDDDNYGLLLNGDELYLEYNGSGGNYQAYQTTNANIPANTWTHIAIAANTTNLTFYVNGLPNASFAITETLTAKNNPVLIGKQNYGTNNLYFNGHIDDLTIYQRTLSPEQIRATYTNKNIIVSQELKIGDNWQACITPNDGIMDGNQTCSNNLTIITPGLNLDPEQANKTYLLNETATLQVNITNNQTALDTITATIKRPDGTNQTINLAHITGNTWGENYTNTTLRGTYNVTYFANDTTSTSGSATSNFIRKSLNTIDIIIQNEEGTPTLENFSFANYSTAITGNTTGLLNLTIDLYNKEIIQINITHHHQNSPYSIIEIFDDEDETLPTPPSFTSYSINPEGLNFTTATLLLNASGNSTLMKCANYNFTEQHCNEGNWTEHLNITKGQIYTVTINSTDPAFIETTAAGDVAMDPLNNTIFLIGFVDIANTDVSFEIVQTNGSIIVAETDVDTSVTTNARVDVNWINSSHFVIFWADTSSNDATFQIFSFDGTSTTSVVGPIDVDTSMGSTNVDVSLAMLSDRFITCYANNADSDADFQAYNFAGTQVVAETAVDGNIQPSSPLQNLIDCSPTNFTRWTYFTFDDSVVNDATYYILDNTGGTIVGATDIDTNVGETGQVAVIGLNGNISGLVWYDATDQDISIAGVNNSGTTIFGPTDVDTAAGTESRVAGAGVRENSTSTEQLFAFAWWSQDDATIKASVYTSGGAQFTAPFNVSTTINSTYPIIDITGRDIATGQEICPGAFLVAFSNGSTGTFLGFWVNGTSWNGTCPVDLIATQLNASDLNPDEQENVTFNGSIFNNGTSTAFNFVAALVDGNCTNGTIIQNITINLSAGQNTTLNFSWNATPVGPHNISFCVDYTNTILEYNDTNNNITITINVKAYNDYFGNLTGNVTLDTNLNRTEYDWRFNDSGNVIFTNSQVNVNFSALYALGRNTSGGIATNDFLDADQALNMTGFNDSIQTLWATNASNPKQTTTFVVRGRTIDNVPYINSTNTSNFITGILWQSGGTEFNATQKQPLLFVTIINRNQTGFYGTYDYEAHVPVLLRSYNSTSNALQYFVELK